MSNKASIIIIHFGDITPTVNCVKSILSSKSIYAYEIIIVDNSNENNSDTFSELSSKITYVRNESNNKGFSAGIKLGISLAKNEYIVILDNDTEVLEGWLDNLIDPFSEFSNVGMTTSEITDPDANNYKIVGGKINILGISYSNKIYSSKNELQDTDELFYGITSWCVKKSLMKKVGVDTSYKFFCDDSDIGYKIKSLGYDIVGAKDSKVLHFKTAKSKKSKRVDQIENYKTVVRNKDYLAFSFKNFNTLHFIIFFMSFIMFKILFIPYRIFSLKRNDIVYDFLGLIMFFNENEKLREQKIINKKINSVSYLSLFRQYSKKFLVSSLIFK